MQFSSAISLMDFKGLKLLSNKSLLTAPGDSFPGGQCQLRLGLRACPSQGSTTAAAEQVRLPWSCLRNLEWGLAGIGPPHYWSVMSVISWLRGKLRVSICWLVTVPLRSKSSLTLMIGCKLFSLWFRLQCVKNKEADLNLWLLNFFEVWKGSKYGYVTWWWFIWEVTDCKNFTYYIYKTPSVLTWPTKNPLLFQTSFDSTPASSQLGLLR